MSPTQPLQRQVDNKITTAALMQAEAVSLYLPWIESVQMLHLSLLHSGLRKQPD